MADPTMFAARGSTDEVEEGRALAPKFDADGLVTCVATDVSSGEVLMVAHMDAEALALGFPARGLYEVARAQAEPQPRGNGELVEAPLEPRGVVVGRYS